MKLTQKLIFTVSIFFVLTQLIFLGQSIGSAQVPVSATPNRIDGLPTTTPLLTLSSNATPTLTFTPQADRPIELEVLESFGSADVHFNGNLDSERIGSINSGEQYVVLGVYYQCIQIQFDPSPDGTGWVFNEYVSVSGDLSQVRDFTVELPTVDPLIEGATQTWQAIELTPGGALTVTANSRVIDAPVANETEEFGLGELPDGVVLPTFTYPANLVAERPTQSEITEATRIPDENTIPSTDNRIAPIIPILVLSGLGILGLLISTVRR